MLSEEAIKNYVNGFNDSKKRKVKNVLTLFMEYQVRNGLDSVSEADVKAFMAKNEGKWQHPITYENYIRDYFRFPKGKKEDNQLTLGMTDTLQSENVAHESTEERSNLSSMEETTTLQNESIVEEATDFSPSEEKKPRRGVRRIQVSVYLEPETYDVLHTLSSVTHYSVSDMLSKAGDELAKKNYNTATQVRERLQGFSMKY